MAKKLGKAAAMAALLGGAALLANRGKGESKTSEKSDTSMMDELAGMDRSTRRGDSSMEDELAGMSRKASARGIRKAAAPTRAAKPAASSGSFRAPTHNEPSLLDLEMGSPYGFVSDAAKRASRAGADIRSRMSEGDQDLGQMSDVVGAKRGGKIKAKKYAGGGSVGSASKRADGCAMRGKTKGRMV
jgi:hypothetical protein